MNIIPGGSFFVCLLISTTNNVDQTEEVFPVYLGR